ncbi:MAG: DUF748 domain-containing protein [Candidatus Methylomirabilia bacterium]
MNSSKPASGLNHPMASHRPRRVPTAPGVVILLILLALLLLPEVVRRLAVRELQARITAPVAIADVDLNLFTGRAHISGLVIGGTNGAEPILRVPRLELSFSREALLRGRLRIHTATAREPVLSIERTGPSRWNVDDFFRPRAAGGGTIGDLSIEQVEVRGGVVTIHDRTTTPVVTSVLQDVKLTVRPVAFTVEAKPGAVTGEARLGKAPLRFVGTLHLDPFITRFQLTGTGVPLSPFQGYVYLLLGNAEARAGTFHGSLDVTAAWTREGYLRIEAGGTVEGQGLAFTLPGDEDPLLRVTRLTADLTRVRNRPTLSADIAKVQITGATLRVTRDRGGTVNLRRLWAAPTPEDAAGAAPGPRSGAPAPIMIHHVAVEDSRVEFVDRTLTPSFTGALSNLRAEVRYPTPQAGQASLRFQGRAGESSPLEFQGWFTPAARPLKVYLEGRVQDYELSRLNPYAEKYVQHRVRRGRVTTAVKYRYDAGNLAAGYEIRIRQIQLGDALGNEFQRQVGIPLKLALILLEGHNSEIRLRIPVEGDLDNPEFRFGSVVWKGVRNAVMKALAIPFRLLGKILTVGGKITEVRIDPVGFQPGSLTPDPKAAARLDRLVTFLRTKPKVELQIRGRASTREAAALARKRPRGRGVTEQDLKALAEKRARLIERTLVRRGVAQKRLFVVTGNPHAVTKRLPGRVEFRLLH